jgi:hypothetical protein
MSAGFILAAGETIDDSLQSLKDAVAKKDTAQIKTLSVAVSDQAGKILSGPAPETEIDKEKVNEAKEAQDYAEYALYNSTLDADNAAKIDLFATLQQVNPKSKYLEDGYTYYFAALISAGDSAKVPGMAEKALKDLPSSPALLETMMNLTAQKNQTAASAAYAQRLIVALGKRTKSDIMPEADWQRRRNEMLGRAHMINGLSLVAQDKNYRADQELRAALPLVTEEIQKAAILFNLALANYNLGRVGLNKGQVLEAAKFSQQCAAIKSQYQDTCARNVTAMKNYATTMH